MSDRRYTAIFGAAVLTASVATFAVYRTLSAAAHPRLEPTRPVVVVTQDVPAGVPVPPEALTSVPWPVRVAPPEALAEVDSVAGRVARSALVKGEPVRAAALAPQGAAPGLEATIAPDRRAIAVRVNEAAGVSGILRPDSRVDVLMTTRADNGGTTARLVMADVRVLGVGPARPEEKKDDETKEPMPASVASIITLEVTPGQAALVAAAEQQGTIQVVLRGFGSRGAATPDAPDAPDALATTTIAGTGAGSPASSAGLSAGSLRAVPARRRVTREPVLPFTPPPPADMGGGDSGGGGALAAASGPRSAVRAPTRAEGARGERSRVASAPAKPAAVPESATVRVYRGGQVTLLRVEATPPPAPPAPAGVHTAALAAP